jgi:dTDP-4-dehydrorhamnose 3,5-epimerase
MPTITDLPDIQGVQLAELTAWSDQRGQFIETFRKEWFPQRAWERVQSNRSDSVEGVLRGLHYHFHQVDYWYVPRGRIRVGLADLRPASPTFRQSTVLELSEDLPRGLYIPCGVAHGFLALTDATLTYIVDNYYDSSDEHGVYWADPDLAVPWGHGSPLLSPRDRANAYLRDIPQEALPPY